MIKFETTDFFENYLTIFLNIVCKILLVQPRIIVLLFLFTDQLSRSTVGLCAQTLPSQAATATTILQKARVRTQNVPGSSKKCFTRQTQLQNPWRQARRSSSPITTWVTCVLVIFVTKNREKRKNHSKERNLTKRIRIGESSTTIHVKFVKVKAELPHLVYTCNFCIAMHFWRAYFVCLWLIVDIAKVLNTKEK